MKSVCRTSCHSAAYVQLVAMCCLVSGSTLALADEHESGRLTITFTTALKGSADWDWTQARTAYVPGDQPLWTTTMSRTAKFGAHGYHDVFESISRDHGVTWSEPKVIRSLRRAKQADGYEVVAGDRIQQRVPCEDHCCRINRR